MRINGVLFVISWAIEITKIIRFAWTYLEMNIYSSRVRKVTNTRVCHTFSKLVQDCVISTELLLVDTYSSLR